MSEPVESGPPSAGARRAPPKGLDEYSDVLGMTPREHDRGMRKWYVLAAITAFFAVFGEGILMLSARRGERQREAERAGSKTQEALAAPRDSASALPR